MGSFFHSCPYYKVLRIEGNIHEVLKERQMLSINSTSLMELWICLYIKFGHCDAVDIRTSHAFKVAALDLRLVDLDDTTCTTYNFQGFIMLEAIVQVGVFLKACLVH
ncbi:hypothetical protein ACFX13_002736 [Malus domestica]